MGLKLKCLSGKFKPKKAGKARGTLIGCASVSVCVCGGLFNFEWKLTKARMKWKLL